jgi:hypothetical protein
MAKKTGARKVVAKRGIIMGTVIGKIAAILSPVKVVINKGSEDGVEKGDYFVIYSEIGPFADPDTKQELGSTKQSWGRVKVTIVEKRFCVAETEAQLRNPFVNVARILGGGMEQPQLPVDETQMWQSVEKIEIGFPARLIKPVRLPEEKQVHELSSAQPSLLGPTTYRRKHGADTWHSCSNCSTWPTQDFDTQTEKPMSGELCNECESKLISHTCQ